MFVKEVKPRIVKNSGGEKTIEIELETYKGRFKASAPSGESRGKHEVAEYHSRGIDFSLSMLKVFCRKIKHKNFLIKKLDDLKLLVREIKKFESQHGRFGANVNYALEAVFLKAAAKDRGKQVWEFVFDSMDYNFNKGEKKKVKIPMPVGNCIGGGKHSSVKNKPDFQEFLLIPNEKSFSKAITKNVHAYHHLKRLLKVKRVDDEHAWITDKTNEDVLLILKKVGRKFGVRIGIDIAASTFYKNGYYYYKNKDLIRDKVDQAEYVERLIKKFGLFYVEDPVQEEDFSSFLQIMNFVKKIKKKVLVVGDDLTVTNLKRVRRAVESKAINAVVVKPNQVGSLIEVKYVMEFCKKHKIATVFSHRSGETMDNVLADLVIGFQGDFLKCGVMGRERLVKLKRVVDIEKGLS